MKWNIHNTFQFSTFQFSTLQFTIQYNTILNNYTMGKEEWQFLFHDYSIRSIIFQNRRFWNIALFTHEGIHHNTVLHHPPLLLLLLFFRALSQHTYNKMMEEWYGDDYLLPVVLVVMYSVMLYQRVPYHIVW